MVDVGGAGLPRWSGLSIVLAEPGHFSRVEIGLLAGVLGGFGRAVLLAVRADSAEYSAVEERCRLFTAADWAAGVGVLLGGALPGEGDSSSGRCRGWRMRLCSGGFWRLRW